jgi:hypothetical protein
MKAQILTIVLLMVTLATFAQSSRRTDAEKSRSNNKPVTQTEAKPSSTTQKSPEVRSNSTNNSQPATNNSRPAANNSGRIVSADQNGSNSNSGSSSRVVSRPQENSVGGRSNHTETTYETRHGNSPGAHNDHDRDRGHDNNHHDLGYDNDHHDRYNDHNRTVIVSHPQRETYVTHYRRPVVVNNYHRRVEPVEVRRVRYPYRAPARAEIVWSLSMDRDYRIFYPGIQWRYSVGYRVASVSAYDARNYIGEVARVYGRVADTYYNADADEYYLYFGDYYPNQDFSIILPGNEARRYNYRPEIFFQNQQVMVTGYVNLFEERPEIQVRNSGQIDIY